uniref:Winged helix family two component transcriptional regulator n=1 Tax=uncultured bacterium pBC1 TaxID=1781160 RepID=A0A1C9U515_9BACT|nr:winged helix family two component transcriptional regulator [uncultured bacterium pBC1]
MNMTCLIVEDEPITSHFIREIIEEQGHNVIGTAQNGVEARALLALHKIDIAILDINIQGAEDGIQLARNMDKNTAVIYISAYSDSQTLKEASETMPYGFLVKPFKETDLIAVLLMAVERIKREHHESEKYDDKKKQFLEFRLDEEKHRLYWRNQSIELSKNEMYAVKLFLDKPDCPITMEELRQAIWGDKNIGDSTIRELINRIRNKVEALSIENIYGTGYILKKQPELID